MADKSKFKPINSKIKIEFLHEKHPNIRASDWRSPLVIRLSGRNKYIDGEKTISNSFRSPKMEIEDIKIILSWNGLKTDYEQCLRTYQVPVITEMATLGLACILVDKHTSLQITEVTRRGEKADYWIGDKDELIEISGQQRGNLSSLRDEKSIQLLDNPFDKAGYVCVANYDEATSMLWYYWQEEDTI